MLRERIRKKIAEQVDRFFEEELDFLVRLVPFKSLVGQEGEAQAFFASACRELGLRVEMFQPEEDLISSHPAYVDIGIDYSGRSNVVARWQGNGGGHSLILNGHMDVVSPEPCSEWSVDPWKGTIRGGRFLGRGTLDMKAGLAANLYAVKVVRSCGFETRGDVILESVIEEEAGGSGGTLACFLRGIVADGMVIPEPSLQTIWITHPGIKYFRVIVVGRPAHAAFSHQGVNAIVKMVPIIKALEALDKRRARSLSYPKVEEQVGRSCNLCLGRMQAGDWVSTVAGWATLECRLGFVPGETGEQVQGEVEETIRNAVKGDDWFAEHPPRIEWFGWKAEPWVEPEDSSFVKAFVASSEKVLGYRPKLTGSSAGLDTRFGRMFGTPSFAFGPKGGHYHSIDEYVEIDSLREVTGTLACFVIDWCGLVDEKQK